MHITIRRRSYAVEPYTSHHGEKKYKLVGPRGGVFRTMRNVHQPHKMFVVADAMGNKTLEGVWLSDADGTIRVLAS